MSLENLEADDTWPPAGLPDGDLLTVLRDRYPQIFSDPGLREIECLAGWRFILDGLCRQIQQHVDRHPGQRPLVARRVKEKYGALKFYFDGGDAFCAGAVALAEDISLTTCEVCGSPGELIGERWFSVRCKGHQAPR